jgi:hypothetical protein
MGVDGAGVAWLAALTVVAAALLWRRDLWLPRVCTYPARRHLIADPDAEVFRLSAPPTVSTPR